MDAFEILVVILSITLAVFLVMAIIATFYIIRVAKHLDHISEKAENVIDNVESASEMIKSTASKASITKAIGSIVDAVSKRNNKEED